MFLMCDLELPGSNPALDTLQFSRSVLHSLKISGGIAPYCKPRLTPLTTHIITIHSIFHPIFQFHTMVASVKELQTKETVCVYKRR